MTRKKKRFVKLLNNPNETSFLKIQTILNDYGYELDRIKGSHFYYKKDGTKIINIPVHNNKVKKQYVKKLIKKIYEEL